MHVTLDLENDSRALHEFEKNMVKYVKQKREKDIDQCVFELRVTPPFPECNRQVREIVKLINALYIRVHREKGI